jgi:hypothetical protein
LQAAKLSQDELITRIDAEEVRTLVSVDYNPNKHRHIAYKPQDVMNWVLQPWYKQMLSMNHLLVSCYSNDSQLNLARYSTPWTRHDLHPKQGRCSTFAARPEVHVSLRCR